MIKTAGAGAYVSVYLSSELARLPVRDVTRLGDNKSDPNLETRTYGLFSTCEPIMRKSILRRGISEIFFVTTVDGLGRSLVGTYELGWVAEVGKDDVAFAASTCRFVAPIVVDTIPGKAGKALQAPLRNFKIVDEDVAASLRSLVNGVSDRTDNYLSEIARLERMSLSRTGFRYPSWDREEAFDWAGATPYLVPGAGDGTSLNVSASGKWACTACGAIIVNEARLKVCNVCREFGTLVPAEVTP